MIRPRDGPVKSQKRLKELRKKAKPILGHPKFIQWARFLTANSVKRVVLRAGGTERQARAARFLAIIKRDYGPDAFDQTVEAINPNHALKKKSTTRRRAMKEPEQEAKEPESGQEPIPLTLVEFDAKISGIMAKVICRQTFVNREEKPIEAVYVFPLPDQASVTACRMNLGKHRTVTAKLKEKQDARREYDRAVSEGHHGALLEQKRPNIFTMNVGGIEPGEQAKVIVTYTQPVPWQADGGRFSIPLVVAPRFIPGKPAGKSGHGWAEDTDQVPDASQITPRVSREGVSYHAEITVRLDPGFPCTVASPSHAAFIPEEKLAKGQSRKITTGPITPDRDFILTYRSNPHAPDIAVHKGEYKGERFAMVSLVPPCQPKPAASDIVFLLDISGSMIGAKIDGLKVIAQKAMEKLRAQEVGHRVGVMVFDHGWSVLSNLSDLDEGKVKHISSIKSRSGGTELGPALTQAFSMFEAESSQPKYILLVTDGDTESVRYAGQGARIIACGIDTAVNDALVKQLARETGGAHEFFYPGEDFDAAANKLVGMLSGPVLRDVSVHAKGDVVGVRDVFYGMPASICLRLNEEEETVMVKGKDPDGKEQEFEIDLKDALECNFCHKIWARDFMRENPQDKDAQIDASLKYGVICSHTSFVAVSEKQVPGQTPEKREIPVCLPHGWDWDSVFGRPRRRRAVSLTDLEPCSFMGGPRGLKGAVFAHSSCLDSDSGVCHLDEELHSDSMGMLLDDPDSQAMSLDSPDFSEVVIAALIALTRGERAKLENVRALSKGVAVLAEGEGKVWDEEKRARTYYFALRLASYGFNLEQGIMSALGKKPISSQAMAWYALAQKELGKAGLPEFDPPSDPDQARYIEWKLGRGSRPAQGVWATVP